VGVDHVIKKEGMMNKKLNHFMATEVMGERVMTMYYFVGGWYTKYEVVEIRELDGLEGMPDDSWWSEDQISLRLVKKHPEYGYKTEKWAPKTDMNQAMECVIEFEKTEPKKIGFKLWYNETCDMWVCEMNYDFICVYDSSPALAICKAIAKAKGFTDV